MTADRTVTVQTADHGAIRIPEPGWCTGDHSVPGFRCDISHRGPDIEVTVSGPSGRRELMTLGLTQWPFSESAGEVCVFVHLADGRHSEYDVAGLEQLAADVVDAARSVHLAAALLASEVSR